MPKVYMGLGFYNIPNQFSNEPFENCIEVDGSIIDQLTQDNHLCWDGEKLIPLVLPAPESEQPV